MKQPLEILLLDDEPVVGDRLKPALEKQGARVETFTDPKLARERISSKDFDVIITDIRMGEVNGIQILEWAMERSQRTKVIMITGYATMQLAREALTKGAFDFIAKPFKMKEVRAAIEKAAKALKAEDRKAGR
jgi:DNA-binding NtrC family response regulator